jgi:hypothetical protein
MRMPHRPWLCARREAWSSWAGSEPGRVLERGHRPVDCFVIDDRPRRPAVGLIAARRLVVPFGAGIVRSLIADAGCSYGAGCSRPRRLPQRDWVGSPGGLFRHDPRTSAPSVLAIAATSGSSGRALAGVSGRPIVLPGHSYGGAVIADAAVGVPQVKAWVYVDALIPAPKARASDSCSWPEPRTRLISIERLDPRRHVPDPTTARPSRVRHRSPPFAGIEKGALPRPRWFARVRRCTPPSAS